MPNPKDEIYLLLSKVLVKFEREQGMTISRNSNRRNYDPIAILLSGISNALPVTAEQLGHDPYPQDLGPKDREYPFRKYDITGNQVKDAYFNRIVSKPRPFLVDACYIYLYGKGRKAFLEEPEDPELMAILREKDESPGEQSRMAKEDDRRNRNPSQWLALAAALFLITTLTALFAWHQDRRKWNEMRADMSLVPYQPTTDEIHRMEGVWLCYTGSPQARPSDPERYHKVVPNIIDIRFKNGYFTYSRYGASFNHAGYMQFEAPNLLSIHTFVKNQEGRIESPRHSLLSLEEDTLQHVISASWNFDVGRSNRIIGIREVYQKQGSGGYLKEIINSLENANCKCKIIEWVRNDSIQKRFYLKNQLLDSISDRRLFSLINEKSILTQHPTDSLLIESH